MGSRLERSRIPHARCDGLKRSLLMSRLFVKQRNYESLLSTVLTSLRLLKKFMSLRHPCLSNDMQW